MVPPCRLFVLLALLSVASCRVIPAYTTLLDSIGSTGSAVENLIFPNVSHTTSEINLANSAFLVPPTLPRLTLRRESPRCLLKMDAGSRTLSKDNDSNPVMDFLKHALVSVERTMVTITQGQEMAEAAAVLEEERFFGSRRLHKAKVAFVEAKNNFLNRDFPDAFSSPMELSAGYNEGDGDDLPLLKELRAPSEEEDSKYSAKQLQKLYPPSTFKD